MTRSLPLRKILWRHISKTKRAINLKFCIRNAFIDIMTLAKFNFNQLMLTLIFSIRASEPPRAWRTTEKAGPDRVNPIWHGLVWTVSYGGAWGPHHNFVVIALMIIKFGTYVKCDVFYTMIIKKFVTSLLLRHYDVITCILAKA